MLQFLLNRIKNNSLLYIFLLGGCILAVAIFSAIPMYSNGILQQVLTTNMEELKTDTKEHPNRMSIEWVGEDNADNDIMPGLLKNVEDQLLISNKDHIIEQVQVVKSSPFRLIPRAGESYSNRGRFFSVDGLMDHTQLIRGSWPNNDAYFEGTRDYMEVVVTEDAMVKLDLLYEEFQELQYNKEFFMKLKVVGIVDKADESELFWEQNQFGILKYSFLVSNSEFNHIIERFSFINIEQVTWNYYFEYEDISIDDVGGLLSEHDNRLRWLNSQTDMTMEYGFIDIFSEYRDKEESLRLTLWILTIPVLLLTSFYTYMISGLIMKNDGNEIAILKSRGAGTFQIFWMYCVQTFVVGVIAFFIGPYLGKLICQLIGSSNGFMEFVARDTLPVYITMEARMYGLLAVFLFILFTLIPAFIASRISIVQYKRSKNENVTKAFWEKSFLDIILLAIAAYGYFTMGNFGESNSLEVIDARSFDPLMFLLSTIFILGVNLFILRIYPYIIRGVFAIFRRQWSPVLYFSLLNVGRADHNLRFIMLFIMLSISFGVLSSSQARTLNQNAIDQVEYFNGADVVVKPYEIEDEAEASGIYANIQIAYEAPTGLKEIVVDDTPYQVYQSMTTADSVTKFLHVDQSILRHGKKMVENMEVIGVVPYEYPNTGWFREDLLDYHINEYMNILTQAPNAVFLSEDLQEEYKIQMGDEITMFWDESAISGIVYGYIPVFPTYEPYVYELNDDDEKELVKKSFVLMNYNYIEKKMPLQDYDIFIEKSLGATDQMVQDELIELGLEAEQVDYTTQQLIGKKNDPILQGINGVLTMCFVVTMVITVIGYLIFWLISMKGRALKFGIFRAMGMTMNQVNGIILTEQILMTGSAIGFGFGLGVLASRLFVPLLQYVGLTGSNVPPFIVVLNQADYIRTLSIAGVMLAFGLAVLFISVRRLKMNQVIKLGED